MARGVALALLPWVLATPAPAASKAEWTVMVYLNGDNNLEKHIVSDFAELARVKSSEAVHVVVQLDRRAGHDDFVADDEQWDVACRFRMRPGLRLRQADALPFSDEAGAPRCREVDMAAPESVGAFVGWARQKFPAKRYALIIADHGSGGLGPKTEKQLERLAQGHDPFRSPGEPPYRSITLDESGGGSTLRVGTLREALEKAALGLDLIGFDACLMSMVETAYGLTHTLTGDAGSVARVLVASQELEPAAGWNHAWWAERLVANPTMDAQTLGATLVESYRKTYDALPAYGWGTLAAVDLAQIDDLAQAIEDLAKALLADLARAHPALRQARNACKSYGSTYGYEHVDLGCVAAQLADSKHQSLNKGVRLWAMAVLTALERAVPMHWAGERRSSESYGSMGLSIYFPPSGLAYKNDRHEQGAYVVGAGKVAFVENNAWARLLHEYFKLQES